MRNNLSGYFIKGEDKHEQTKQTSLNKHEAFFIYIA